MPIHFHSHVTNAKLFVLESQHLIQHIPRIGEIIVWNHTKYEVAYILWDYDQTKIIISLRPPLGSTFSEY